MQLTAVVAELRQAARNLEISIEHEEERACIFVARQLKDRRDKPAPDDLDPREPFELFVKAALTPGGHPS